MRYLITFPCYGAHIHGEEGTVDLKNNRFGGPKLEVDGRRAETERRNMKESPYLLDAAARAMVLAAIQEVCAYRSWILLAAHVRTNHVHVVVEAECKPEKALNDFKAYSSRALNRDAADKRTNRWARHGSTRWLWKDQEVRDAIRYVVDEQGVPMAVYVGEIP